MPNPALDIEAAHRHFAAECFNSAWDLIEKIDRTPADDRMMVALNYASIYHWVNRPDCDDMHLSIGYWQASRIQSTLGNAAEARRQAEVCLSYSTQLDPFYLGYAHEALAHAAMIDGAPDLAAIHIAEAEALCQEIAKPEDREALQRDLANLNAS